MFLGRDAMKNAKNWSDDDWEVAEESHARAHQRDWREIVLGVGILVFILLASTASVITHDVR